MMSVWCCWVVSGSLRYGEVENTYVTVHSVTFLELTGAAARRPQHTAAAPAAVARADARSDRSRPVVGFVARLDNEPG